MYDEEKIILQHSWLFSLRTFSYKATRMLSALYMHSALMSPHISSLEGKMASLFLEGRKLSPSPGWSWNIVGGGLPPWCSGHGLQTNALCASLQRLPTNLLLQGIHSGLILLFFSLTKGKNCVGRKAFILRRTVQCILVLLFHWSVHRAWQLGRGSAQQGPGL